MVLQATAYTVGLSVDGIVVLRFEDSSAKSDSSRSRLSESVVEVFGVVDSYVAVHRTALSVDSVIVNFVCQKNLTFLSKRRSKRHVHTMAKPALKVIMCLVCSRRG